MSASDLKNKSLTVNMTLSAMFLAFAMLLPFVTGQIPAIGQRLLPMHIPVILCGFICGPWWGLGVGALTPILRSLIFGIPVMITALPMAFELAAYGFFCGLFIKLLPKKLPFLYIDLILAMIAGRIIWGVASVCILGIADKAFGWSAFFTGAFINAFPGIILQLIIIPPLVKISEVFQKNHIMTRENA